MHPHDKNKRFAVYVSRLIFIDINFSYVVQLRTTNEFRAVFTIIFIRFSRDIRDFNKTIELLISRCIETVEFTVSVTVDTLNAIRVWIFPSLVSIGFTSGRERVARELRP